MKFLDAHIFIYAYYKPRQQLTEKQKEMKDKSKEILRKINEGEEVTTTVIHLSEISNILKRSLDLNDLSELLIGLYSMDNIKIVDVTKGDYLSAIELMEDITLDPNDCLAIEIIRREGIDEIYSFDGRFDGVRGVKRVA